MLGRIISRLADKFLLAQDDEQEKIIFSSARKNLSSLVVGDIVEWDLTDNQQGIITKLHNRKNLITRPDPFNQFDKPVAANIDLLLVVTAALPKIDLSLLDEYLILSNFYNIKIAIIYNKLDLQKLDNQLDEYQSMSYKIVKTCVKSQAGISDLKEILTNKTSIFVGQSGVGKSSLLNCLLPDKNLKTQQLSDLSQGKHTTSHSTLHFLDNGGKIIDTPGVRAFGLWKLTSRQIHQGFQEIYQISTQCYFNNCQHIQEPKCAVKKAVQNGTISNRRYNHYCHLITSLVN